MTNFGAVALVALAVLLLLCWPVAVTAKTPDFPVPKWRILWMSASELP